MKRISGNIIFVSIVFIVLLFVLACKSQQASANSSNNSVFDVNLLCKVWKYEKFVIDVLVKEDVECIDEKRLHLKKDNTFKTYFTKELDCDEKAEEGTWSYNASSNTININSENSSFTLKLDTLTKDKMHVKFTVEDQDAELFFISDN